MSSLLIHIRQWLTVIAYTVTKAQAKNTHAIAVPGRQLRGNELEATYLLYLKAGAASAIQYGCCSCSPVPCNEDKLIFSCQTKSRLYLLLLHHTADTESVFVVSRDADM